MKSLCAYTGSLYAYKGFEHDLTCRGFQYEVGKTYTFNGDPILCDQGFHCCGKLSDVFTYYPIAKWEPSVENNGVIVKTVSTKNRYCIVEVLGDVDVDPYTSKMSTNKIKIVLELTSTDIISILNAEFDEADFYKKRIGDWLQKAMHVKIEEDK